MRTSRQLPPWSILLVLVLAVQGCGPTAPERDDAAPRIVHEDPDLVVWVERVGGARFDHPADLTPENVRSILEGVYYAPIAGHRTLPERRIFADHEVVRLKSALASALVRIAPDERIGFTSVAGKGPVPERAARVTSGVIFVSGGDLHLVLAACNDSRSGPLALAPEMSDPTLRTAPENDWRLVPRHGQRFHGIPGEPFPHAHWLVIDLVRYKP